MSQSQLLFFFSEDFDDEALSRLREEIERAKGTRSWVIEPPRFVDETDEGGRTRPEDEPIRTVGGALLIPSRGASPEVEAAALADVESLVAVVERFSKETGAEFEFELDGVFVGEIVDGDADDSLRVGLIEEWKRGLPTPP